MKLFYLFITLYCSAAFSLDSVKLKDTIKQGYGYIDLFRAQQSKNNLTASDLEFLRVSSSENLVFAVDINEAANGTEKASTQGVTVDSVSLIIVRQGIESRYNQFSTPTSSLVARIGETTREFHYTLIGETGSSRITGSGLNDITAAFDSLLTVEVPDSIENADEAYLEVRLMQTNTSLGDPEAFYDYTAGFEDLALVNPSDAQFLADLSPGVDEAPLVVAQSQVTNPVDAWVYYPSSTSYYVVAYEDQYPNRGDYDFNDLVVGYRVGFGMTDTQVTSVIGVGYMIARGASANHNWHLHIPFSEQVSGNALVNLFKPDSTEQIDGYPQLQSVENRLNLKLYENTKHLMKVEGSDFANTLASQTPVKGHKFSFSFDLDSPISFSAIPAAPYDPYLHVLTTGYEIHLSGHLPQLSNSTNSGDVSTDFKDQAGYPYALVFPDQWLPPLEYTDLGDAYDNFVDYTMHSTQEYETWYKNPKQGKTKSISSAFWKW